MGEQFWWFYDVLTAAIVLVSAFLSGRKGIFKAMLSFSGYALSFIIAFSICGNFASSFYKGSVRSSNVKKLSKSISETEFIPCLADHLNQTYPSVAVDSRQLEEICKNPNFNTKEKLEKRLFTYLNSRNSVKVDTSEGFEQKLHEGYAHIMTTIVKEGMTAYSAETASIAIIDDPESFYELLPMLLNKELDDDAAEFIADNYIKKAYEEEIALAAFVVFLLLGATITLIVVKTITNIQRDSSIGSRAAGACIGIVSGLAFACAAAAIVRLNIILGNDKMLFFNFKAVDKTYIFKYLYNFILSKM